MLCSARVQRCKAGAAVLTVERANISIGINLCDGVGQFDSIVPSICDILGHLVASLGVDVVTTREVDVYAID